MRDQVFELMALLDIAWNDKELEYPFHPFEGYRTPERQDHLYVVEKTTRARGWQSAHQLGLAVDFVPKKSGQWFWPEADHRDWTVLGEAAASVGLIQPIKWDRPHIEHPAYEAIRRAL